MGFSKYTWVGNQISNEDMYQLYLLKEQTRIPITKLVAEAIKSFLNRGAALKGVSVKEARCKTKNSV